MNEKLMDCFTNPVKCKLFLEIKSKGRVTAKQLAKTYSDIPQATLYRYLNRMLSDGILKVTEENKVRGTIEKVYAVEFGLFSDIQKMLMGNSGEAYMQMFTQYMIGLLSEFKGYAFRKNIDILHDGSGFSTVPFYATMDELEEALKKVTEIIEPLKNNKPRQGRRMRSLALIVTPPKAED